MLNQSRAHETRRSDSDGYVALAQTMLYDRFIDARRRAVELTDRYNAIAPNDPTRDDAWAQVVLHTEAARQLLETWLRAGSDDLSVTAGDRPSPVGIA